jgi:hypothetical protein
MARFPVVAIAASVLVSGTALAQTPGKTGGQPSKAGLLDGNAYEVKMKPGAAEKGVKEQDSELVFENGTVSAEGWEAQGFQAGPYTASKLPDGTLSFNASQTSATNGTVTWSGTIDANGDLAGTAIWTKPGGSPVTYALDGERDLGKEEDKGAVPPQKDAPKPR